MDVVDNTEMRHFEMREEGQLATIEYQVQEKKYFLTSAHFPPQFEENGKADEMMTRVMEMIEETGMRVVPMTRFAKSFIKKNRQRYKSLLPVGIQF